MNIHNLTDEQLAIFVHKVYCKQYKINHGKKYWTNGDYSKLTPDVQAYDLALVKFLRQCVADSIPSEEEIKKVILRWDSVIADDGLAEDMACAIRKLMEASS